MSNQQLYNQHRANGVPHEEAATALGVNAATARTLKSRYTNQSATPEAKPRKVKPVIQTATHSYDIASDTWNAAGITTDLRATQTPPTKFDLQAARNAAVSLLLIGVVIGHSGLVWYDCADRWSVPGAIGGGVVFLIVLAALLLASDETKPRTSEAAMWFVFITDFAAWFVHFPVFRDRAQIGNIETGMFAGFLCACSFAALYLFRDSKLD